VEDEPDERGADTPNGAREPEVLAAIADGLTPFASDEIAELERYRLYVQDFATRQLADRKKLNINIGPSGLLFRDFDPDRYGGLALAFRKVGWANEPASFNRVRNMLANHARESGTTQASTLIGWLGALHDLRRDMLRQSRFLGYVLENQDGATTKVTPEEILDLMINGYLFHGDEEKRKRWDDLGGLKSPALVIISTLTMWDMLAVFRALDQVVERVLTTPALCRR
jgi:hypothetical protein